MCEVEDYVTTQYIFRLLVGSGLFWQPSRRRLRLRVIIRQSCCFVVIESHTQNLLSVHWFIGGHLIDQPTGYNKVDKGIIGGRSDRFKKVSLDLYCRLCREVAAEVFAGQLYSQVPRNNSPAEAALPIA